ncbi:MAG: hypothetical protein K8W52_09860 [Deltaproteobacteria bacterium]|nr:hypothetical protein [Deltaproteobacteria bacterium]
MRSLPMIVMGVAAATLTVSISAARADADSLTEDQGARELALGGGMRAGATGALATTLNPAGLPLSQDLVFEGAYGYRPSDSASVLHLSACDSTTAAPGCFYYNYVSASPGADGMETKRRAHTFGLTMSRQILPHILIGSAVKYFDYNSKVMGETDTSGFNWDLGMTVKVSDLVNIAVVGYDLWGAKSTQFPRAIGSGIMARPTPAMSLVFDGLWNLDASGKTGRYGGGAEYYFTGRQGQLGVPVRLGAVYDSAMSGTFISGGLGLTSLKVGLDLGARKEVKGGDEFVFTASLRFFGPRGVSSGGGGQFLQ